MVIKIAYDSNSDRLVNEIRENYPNVTIEAHDEETLRGKKEAWALKGAWAARINPFAIIFDDENKVIKAFYSEVKECTFDNINNVLMSYE